MVKLVGDEVVLAFIVAKEIHPDVPIKQLIDFKRVHLKPQESSYVAFEIIPEKHLSHHVVDDWRILSGSYALQIGDVVSEFVVE